jgi:hypothetical protein
MASTNKPGLWRRLGNRRGARSHGFIYLKYNEDFSGFKPAIWRLSGGY